jgi:CBS domain-containing protein
MKVADIMTNASVSESPSDTLKDAATRMWQQQTGSLLVMDGDALLGIVTERDIMKAVAHDADVTATPISSIMSKDVLTVEPSTPLYQAARQMAARWIRHLPVVDAGKVVGVVSQRDLVGVLAALDHDPEGVELPVDQLVRERRLVRLEHGDLD